MVTTAYAYNGTAHKQPTLVETTNSDGSIIRQITKYSKDFTTAIGQDSMVNALHRMKAQNINQQVEQYRQVQRGATTVVTNASITLHRFFKNFVNYDLPYQVLTFSSPIGVTDFQAASVSANQFSYDSRYRVKSNFTDYSGIRQLAGGNDARRNYFVSFTDFRTLQVVASFKNAQVGEVAFTDFDSFYGYPSFSFTDTTMSPTDRNGQLAAKIKSSSVIVDTVKRKSPAQQYVFSLWVNASAATTISVISTDGTQIVNNSLSVPNTAGKWKYLVMKLPVSSLGANFTVKLSPATEILVDDLLLYPENASVSTTAYRNSNFQTLSETDGNGISTYFDYDLYGRLRFVYDQDGNIIKKTSYYTAVNANDFFTPIISPDGIAVAGNYNNPIHFNVPSENIFLNTDGTQYTWNFGDGGPVVKTFKTYLDHTYRSAGSFNVSVTKSSPVYGTKSANRTITVGDTGPTNVAVGVQNVNGGTITGLQFFRNGALVYNFNQSQIAAGIGPIQQAIYDVKVFVNGVLYNPSNFTGYKRVVWRRLMNDGTTATSCTPFIAGNNNNSTYNFSGVDLNGAASISTELDITDCQFNAD